MCISITCWTAGSRPALQTGTIPAEDLGNPGIYPPDAVKAKLFGETKTSLEIKRLRSRLWASVKTGE